MIKYLLSEISIIYEEVMKNKVKNSSKPTKSRRQEVSYRSKEEAYQVMAIFEKVVKEQVYPLIDKAEAEAEARGDYRAVAGDGIFMSEWRYIYETCDNKLVRTAQMATNPHLTSQFAQPHEIFCPYNYPAWVEILDERC